MGLTNMRLSWLKIAYTARKLMWRGGAQAKAEGGSLSAGLFHDEWIKGPQSSADSGGTKTSVVQIRMRADELNEMRHFYLELLGLSEVEGVNDEEELGAFWASTGLRKVYFGDRDHGFLAGSNLVIPDLDPAHTRLTDAGVTSHWDNGLKYVRRLQVRDPAGNHITLVGA